MNARLRQLRWALVLRLTRAPPPAARLRVVPTGGRDARVVAHDSYAMIGTELRRTVLLDIDDAYRRRRELSWSPDHPRSIHAAITLADADGQVLDHVDSYFGLRSVEVRDGRFLLDRVPTYMRLVLAQNYWPETHLAAPSGDALRREVELAKSLGFNGVRSTKRSRTRASSTGATGSA